MKKPRKIIWKKYELKYEHHKNSGATLVFVHGFDSSKDFANPFLELNTNFNIYTIDLPGSKYNLTSKDISIEMFNQLVKKMLKKLKLRKVILFGHSMGGAIVASASKSWRVKKVFYLCPLHPYIYKNSQYKMLWKHYYPQNKKEQKLASLINKLVKNIFFIKKIKQIQKFLTQETLWAQIVTNNLLNKNYLAKLSSQMQKTLKKATFFISTHDNVVGTKSFIKWANSINQKYIFIGKDHNPLIKHAKKIAQYIKDKLDVKDNL